MMRIVFMGSAEVSAVMLDALVYMEAAEVVGVVTQPDRPCGRHQHFMPCACKAKAQVNGLEIACPENVNNPAFLETLRGWAPDLIVVVAYGQFLKRPILELPPLGCINIHLSLLPRYRGAAPVQHALAAGETVTGVTAMMMDQGMDSGDILLQAREPILPTDTAATLHDRLSLLGAVVLLRVTRQAELGQLQCTPQDVAQVSFAPKLKKGDGLIDWSLPARQLERLVRAYNPWPACFTWMPLRLHNGTPLRVKVLRAQVLPDKAVCKTLAPGMICRRHGMDPVVRTGKGALRLLEVQPEGARPMSGRALLCGYPLQHGDHLGAAMPPRSNGANDPN